MRPAAAKASQRALQASEPVVLEPRASKYLTPVNLCTKYNITQIKTVKINNARTTNGQFYIMNMQYREIKAAQASGNFGGKSNAWDKLGETTGSANFLLHQMFKAQEE